MAHGWVHSPQGCRCLIGNVAHLTASTTIHFSKRFSPLPLLYTLKSFHCLQFCCATAVAPFEISWPFSIGLKGVANSCFSAGRLLDGSSAASPLPPPQARWVAECPDPKQLLLDKAMAAPLRLTPVWVLECQLGNSSSFTTPSAIALLAGAVITPTFMYLFILFYFLELTLHLSFLLHLQRNILQN